jgi:hypothetical protein
MDLRSDPPDGAPRRWDFSGLHLPIDRCVTSALEGRL